LIVLLRSYNGGWCPLPKILDLHIAQYNARILELKHKGYDIQNKTEWIKGERHSWFRLDREPEEPRPAFMENNGQMAFMR
jgi:hypothetical protein